MEENYEINTGFCAGVLSDLRAAAGNGFHGSVQHGTGRSRRNHEQPEVTAPSVEEEAPVLEAYSGQCGDNLTWTLSDDGVLTISGTGPMADYYDEAEDTISALPWENHKQSISSIVIEDGVTRIGNAAFYELSSVTDVVIPASVNEIGFAGFCACWSLTAMTIPEGVTTIGANAFLNCMSLMTVTIPSSVTEICDYAFCGTPSLQGFQVDSANPCFANDEAGVLFSKDGTRLIKAPGMITTYAIPEGVTVIGSMSFNTCINLTELVVPASMETVEYNAFEYCNSQPTIRFRGNAPTFERDAFFQTTATVYYPAGNDTWTSDVMQQYGGTVTWESCDNEDGGNTVASGTCGENLTWVIADGVLTVSGEGSMTDYTDGANAPWMAHTDHFTSVVLEEGVTTVGIRAFSDATNVTGVELPQSLTSIGEEAFYMAGLTEISIPANLNALGARALVCPNMTAIHVDEANTACYSWNGVLYSDSVLIQVPGGHTGELELHTYTHYINNYALLGCSRLEKLIVPSNIYEIRANVFSGCTSLTEIQFLGDAPETIPENALDGLTVTVSHPDANTTWTEEVKLSFGGTVTWTTFGENLVAQGYCGENGFILEDGTYSQSAFDLAAGDNATWTLRSDGTMVVSGQGRMLDCMVFAASNPWSTVSDRVTRLLIREGITYVGLFSFLICSELEEVILPSTLEELGQMSFSMLKKLETVTLPGNLKHIGASAFNDCTALTEIKFLGDAPAIEADAFTNVTATAFYPEGNATWTEETMQQYGGTITWVAYTPEISGACGDHAYWKIEGDGVLTVYGQGDMWDFGETQTVPWYDHIGNIKALVIEEGITRIGDFAFMLLPILEVTVPETVTDIGRGAFSFTFGLHSAKLPQGLISIGDQAFALSALCEITIPASVESIGTQVFMNCPNMTAIYVDEANANFYTWNGALYAGFTLLQVPGGYTGELELHTYTHYINNYALLGCSRLEKLIVPSNIYEIRADVFSGCTSLTEIQFLGDAPETIPENALDGLTVTVSHPDANTTWTEEVKLSFGGTVTWTTFGENLVAQGYCEENGFILEDGTFSQSEFDLAAGDNATWTLRSDGTMTISGEGKMVDNFLVGYHPWFTTLMRDLTQVRRFVVEEGITHIGALTFMCFGFMGEHITEVVLPSTVKTIGYYALAGLTSLEQLDLPEGISRISPYAFGSCTALTSVEIPASVTAIDSSAFYGCTALTEIKFLSNAPVIAEDAFQDVVATAYYPTGNPTWTEDVLQNYGGTVTWVPYGEVEEEPIVITAQPVDYVGMVGDMATFTVAAEGEGLTYQWYYFDREADDWKKSGNGTSATLEVEFKAYRNNQQYRCVITDAEGNSVTTDTVSLVAQEMNLIITAQPVSYEGSVNDDVVFTVDATGNGLVYQWFYSDDDGATWKKSGSPGFDTAILTPVLRAYRDGYQFCCQITDVFGNSVISDAVSMTVKASDVVITSQPQDVEMAILGQLYQFSVEATGDNLTYRWEVSTDGGETWEESWNQGYESTTLNVRMNANRDGNMYRCVITSGLKTSVTSEPALLDLQDPSVELVSQSGSVTAVTGTTVSFHVEATGNDLTYAWYRSNDKGTTWVLTYLSGYNTDTLSFVANANRAAMYKCKITDGSGKAVWSTDVKLQVLSAELKILTQPESMTCASGETAAFTVEAQGDSLKYQWYASSDGGETWTETYLGGYNTNELSFVVNASRASKLYKCVITDAVGNKVETDAVSVTVG